MPFALVATALVMFASACGSTETVDRPASSELEYWPTSGWRTSDPADHGFDRDQLRAIEGSLAGELPFLDSLLVIRDGFIVYEQYFNGFDVDTLHPIASVTKSWTSAAAGVASKRAEAPGLDAPISSLLPAYFENGRNSDKATITYRQLLQMRSGIDFSEDALDSGGYGSYADLAAQDLTAWGLGLPVAHRPGEAWNYSTLDSQLVSAVLQASLGVTLEELVDESLFGPLGTTDYTWFADAAGTTIGGMQLNLSPRDMAKLGLLYLEEGRWEGEQLIPAEWITESTQPQGTEAYVATSGQNEEIAWYGYHWWTWGPEWFGGYSGLQAKGYGGQQILLLPELELIIVTTAGVEGVDVAQALEQEAAIYGFLKERLLPALDEADWNFDQ